MNRVTIQLIIHFLLAATLGGCAVFTPPLRDAAPLAMPPQFSLYTARDSGPNIWWRAFGRPMPMIMETSRQARMMIPMAISLGFGVLFSTMVVVPSLYVMLDDVGQVMYTSKEKEAGEGLVGEEFCGS